MSFIRSSNGPDVVGSASPPQKKYPRFPNIPELVLEEENAHLLAAVLPALTKFKCLEFQAVKSKRSPWVRAFVELYHPGVGAWGKFSNAPAISSKTRYSFKSYKIAKIYECLNKYKGNNEIHLSLRRALEEFYSKNDYHRDFMNACERICILEVNKPSNQRAPIPTVNVPVVAAGVVDDGNATNQGPPTAAAAVGNTTSEAIDLTDGAASFGGKRANTTASAQSDRVAKKMRAEKPGHSTGRVLRSGRHLPETLSTPQSLAQRKNPPFAEKTGEESTDDEEKEGAAATASRPVVTPAGAGQKTDDDDSKSKIENKRKELVNRLELRRKQVGTARADQDKLCQKFQENIDKLDEELLEMIMNE